jgi:lysophospholipase
MVGSMQAFKRADAPVPGGFPGRMAPSLVAAARRALARPEASGPAPAHPRTFRPVREGLVPVSGVPLPAGYRNRTITAADGVRLRGAFWRPEGAARGTVCLFQGRAEFIEKYGEVVQNLLERGFAVATFDFRGQGGSDRLTRNPLKSHVEDFDQYRADAEAMMRQIALASCPPPFHALSHSMSAPVLVSLALRQPQWFERLVLVAPMVGLPLARVEFFARGLATGLGRLGFSSAYIPGGTSRVMALRPFARNPVTSDPDRYAQAQAILAEAPELALGSPTVGWVHAAFRAMTATAARGVPESFRTPTLVLSAARDRIVDPRASDRFAARIRGGGHLMVRASRHEIMMERDDVRDLFWAAFDAFAPGARDLA